MLLIHSGSLWMEVVFTKYSLIVLQAILPKRADPTELKAIFEKVGLYPDAIVFSFVSSLL